jgi:hypothetical protein
MAERPVFVPVMEGPVLVRTLHVDFQWFPGMSVSQKQKSVDSLHGAAQQFLGPQKILEVSSKSRDELGIALSAFNLTVETVKHRRKFCVECAYQGSKVFEHGGPFIDLFEKTAREAKRDDRLKTSGRLIGFHFYRKDWALEPQTAFYDWLYINALAKREGVVQELEQYSAFTDIEFNPEKSINCQAYSVALFLALHSRSLLEHTREPEEFLRVIQGTVINNARQDRSIQEDLLS